MWAPVSCSCGVGEESFQPLTTEYDVSWRLVTYDLYYIKVCSFYTQFVEGFYNKKCWILSHAFSVSMMILRVFSRKSQTVARWGESQFTGRCRVHSHDWGLYVYYLMHGWAGLLPGPLVCMVLDPTAPTKAFFSMDGCWISVGGECTKMKGILFHHDASVTLLYLVIYFTSFDTDKWYDLCDSSLPRDSIGFSWLYNLPRSVQAHHCPVPWSYSFLQLLIFGLWHTRLIWGS